jgi:hypothetical protein
MNKETDEATHEAFNKLLDSLPSTEEAERDEFVKIIKAFPDRSMSIPERRGGLSLDWTHQWPWYEVTFTGWIGAAGLRERELVEKLAVFGEPVEAAFIKTQGYAQMRIRVDYGDLAESGEKGLDKFRKALNLIRRYRVESGYTWVEYDDIEEALRG